MRSIPLKAALAAMIVAIPLTGAFAASSRGGDHDGNHGHGQGGSSLYGDFSQNGWFDGINSFKAHPTAGKNLLQQFMGE
ncbi:hypothetical protein OHD62_01800 [Mesorhizobium sp. YC-39]|uniref:hypothetical protein n=1 Tax=unclassified Mesorhizobium TaxID=325217 RepID=UPI0021E7E652|nr:MULTISPECIES: hypothetical protein [unclassified Mesorhizobium]MCV3206509.1 hypothetical protein [Mesorhizobium sp. YC-2]MCV3227091.1 hypothetical protein [Mesorhizobium sp. YC-39]